MKSLFPPGVIITNKALTSSFGEIEMDTANPGSVSRGTRARATLRAFLPVCLALLVSGLLLSVWLTAVSARIPDQLLGAPVDSPDDNPALSDRSLTSQQITSSAPLLAPSAGIWDLGIQKSVIPPTFTVGTNNRYIITVSAAILTQILSICRRPFTTSCPPV